MPQLPKFRAGALGGGVGLIVIAVGLLVIGIGWNGMAGGGGEVHGVPSLNAQLPWLVSGGVLGLALVIFGAALVVVHNARTDRARLESKLDDLIDTVARSGNGVHAPQSVADLFVAGGASYHRSDCRLAQGRTDATYVTAAEAAARELRPCRVCRPDDARALVR